MTVSTTKKTSKKPIAKKPNAAKGSVKKKKPVRKNNDASKTSERKNTKKGSTTGSKPVKGSTVKAEDSSKPRDVQVKEARKTVYPDFDVFLYLKDDPKSDGPLTVDVAKKLLGWQEESDNVKFGDDYLFKDKDGNKVRCNNNLTNRPFDPKLAEDWMLEILRGKWKLNGETIIIDKLAMIHDGQHRLIGLVLAEQLRLKNREIWEAWKEPCFLQTVVIIGVEYDDATINTINTGKTRSLADVIYRCPFFQKLAARKRKKVAKTAEYAVKYLWNATGAKEHSFAPRMPHSESLEFLEVHGRLLDCLEHIWEEDGGKDRKLSSLVPIGTASAMMFLMASETTDPEDYEEYLTEDGIDFSNWDKAEEFWTLLAGNSKEMEAIRNEVARTAERFKDYPKLLRQCSTGAIVKGWHLWSDGKKPTPAKVKMEPYETDMGAWTVDPVYLGGIDSRGVDAG